MIKTLNKKRITAFLFAVLLVIEVMFSLSPLRVSAEGETQYSNVLDDLKKDPSFNPEDYPADPVDYSLKVIQIAESEDGELFLYVYQPSHNSFDLKAVSASIHIGYSVDGSGLDPEEKSLTLVSSDGVFDKYLVNDFLLPTGTNRYYNIVSISREFNKNIDKDTGVTTKAVAYSVGQQWSVFTLNNNVVYEMNTFMTQQIEYTMASSVTFQNGITWGSLLGVTHTCDSHFFAFNLTERSAKKIFEAKVWYEYIHRVESVPSFGDPAEDPPVSDTLTLTEHDEMIYEGSGWLGDSFSWNRIMKASEFKDVLIKNKIWDSVSSEDRAIIENSQWVFSYKETPRTFTYNFDHMGNMTGYTDKYYEVSGKILTLSFQDFSGKYFDLGVVSNTVQSTGSIGGSKPEIDIKTLLEDIKSALGNFFEFASLALVAILLIALINPIFVILKFIISVIRFLINLFVSILSIPFKYLKRKK